MRNTVTAPKVQNLHFVTLILHFELRLLWLSPIHIIDADLLYKKGLTVFQVLTSHIDLLCEENSTIEKNV